MNDRDVQVIADATTAAINRLRDVYSRYPDHRIDPHAAEADALAEDARQLAVIDPAFAVVFGHVHNAGQPAVPLAADGSPLPDAVATADLAALLAYWRAHPGTPAGRPCGEGHDLVAAGLDRDGLEWLKLAATDPAWQPDPDHRDYAAPLRSHAGTPVWCVQRRQPPPASRWIVTRGSRAADAAVEAFRPQPPVTDGRTILVWHWPNEGSWSLPVGKRTARGIRLLSAVPCPDAVLNIGGKSYVTTWFGPAERLQPCPAWVCEGVLGGRRS
jgi:hypothetical protein